MYELEKEEMFQIQDYYQNSNDSCIISALQGYMGRAFVENIKDRAMSMIVQGDFVFPSGDETRFDPEIADQMLKGLEFLDNFAELLIVPQNKAWHEFLLSKSDMKVIKRYSLHKIKLEEFDLNNLKELAGQLPVEYHFARMDEAIATQALSSNWSSDFVSNFESAKDFVQRGIGIAIMKENELVCGATSYTVYNQGIEVEIATKPEYCKQGLATMCGARLVIECIKESRQVNWDAANLTSVKIAKKLGYTFQGEYDTFIWG